MQGFFDSTQFKDPLYGRGKTCTTCGLYKNCNTPRISPYGNFEKKILIILDKPSRVVDNRGVEKDKRLQFLSKELESYNISIERDCVVSYAIICFDAKNRLDTSNQHDISINACRKNVINLILERHPEKVLLLGTSVTYSVLKYCTDRADKDIHKWRGFQIPDQKLKTTLCPLYSVDFIQESPVQYLQRWRLDLKNALNAPKLFPDYQDIASKIVLAEEPDEISKIIRTFIRQKETVTIDIEGTGLKPQNIKKHKIVCISLSNTHQDTCIVFPEKGTKSHKLLKRLLEDPEIGKVAQNMKFEDTWLNVWAGITIQNWEWDTMQATHILDNRPGITGLKFQTYVQLGVADYEVGISQYLKSNSKNANATNTIVKAFKDPQLRRKIMLYCGLDSYFTRKLKDKQQVYFDSDENLMRAYKLFHDGILALAKAERAGMRIDTAYISKKKRQLDNKISKLEIKLEATKFIKDWKVIYRSNFNMNSDKKLAHYLYDIKKLKATKQTKQRGSTDEESLRLLNIPELIQLLDIKRLKRLRDVYLDGFEREQVDNFLHPFYNLHIPRTFRSSSSNPNFQNIPKRDKYALKLIRDAIYPRRGNQLMEGDFSKLEVSIAACYHKDPNMLKYLTSSHNDMHGDLAQQIYIIKDFDKNDKYHSVLRASAKNGFIFPQFYGDYYKNNADGLQQWIKVPSGKFKPSDGILLSDDVHIGEHLIKHGIKSFTAFIRHLKDIEDDFWGNRFKHYARWKKKWMRTYEKNGYFYNHTGFIFNNPMRKNAVINYPVQSAAFHCLLWSFTKMTDWLEENNMQTCIIGQIHDAIVFDVYPPELEVVSKRLVEITTKELPEAFPWIIVPLQIDAELCPVDASWATKEHYNLPKL